MVGAGSATVTCLIVDIFGDLVSCSAACGFVCWECGLTNSSVMADFMVCQKLHVLASSRRATRSLSKVSPGCCDCQHRACHSMDLFLWPLM